MTVCPKYQNRKKLHQIDEITCWDKNALHENPSQRSFSSGSDFLNRYVSFFGTCTRLWWSYPLSQLALTPVPPLCLFTVLVLYMNGFLKSLLRETNRKITSWSSVSTGPKNRRVTHQENNKINKIDDSFALFIKKICFDITKEFLNTKLKLSTMYVHFIKWHCSNQLFIRDECFKDVVWETWTLY